MPIGLKSLTTIAVVLVVLIVGGTCLGVTVGTTLNVFNDLSQSWAQSIASNIAVAVENYFSEWEKISISAATSFKQAKANKLPTKLKSEDGRNWTDVAAPLLLQIGAKTNFNLGSAGCTFNDYSWMYVASNSFRDLNDPRAWVVEWAEVPSGTTDVYIGGFQFLADNITPIPYGPETNNSYVAYFSDAALLRRDLASTTNFFQSKARLNPTELATILWSPIYHHYLPRRNIFWEIYIIAGILDESRNVVGTLNIGLTVERDLTALLKDAPRSANTEIFLITPLGDIIATTREQRHWFSVEVNHAIPASDFGSGCSRTEVLTPGLQPPRLGCLMNISTYPYAPLNAVSYSFAATDSEAFDFFDVSSGIYAISSKRVKTPIGGYRVNVIAIVPEDDLGVGDFQKAMGLAAGLCALVFLCMIGIALYALHMVTKRLQVIQTKLFALANLRNLDAEDVVDEGIDDGAMARREEQEAINAFENRMKGSSSSNINMNQDHDFGLHKYTNHVPSTSAQADDSAELEDTSWISEIANLEEAYRETARSMTNFTRYVSRAVVSELIISRSIMNQRSKAAAKLTTTNRTRSSAGGVNSTFGSNQNGEQQQQQQQATEDFAGNVVAEEEGTCLRSYDDLTVLFVEIEGFSNIWRMTNPEYHAGVCMVLHIYFKRMCRLIMGHGGIVDRFLGDSIMSYWGAPVQTEYHAHFAVLCALALLRETTRDPLKKIFMNAFNKQLKLRGGLASGTALVGTIETRENLNYTILGTPVTHAKHLQSFNKAWKTSMLMDQNTAMKVGDMVHSRLLCNAVFNISKEDHLEAAAASENNNSKNDSRNGRKGRKKRPVKRASTSSNNSGDNNNNSNFSSSSDLDTGNSTNNGDNNNNNPTSESASSTPTAEQALETQLKKAQKRQKEEQEKLRSREKPRPVKVYELVGLDTESRLVRDRVYAARNNFNASSQNTWHQHTQNMLLTNSTQHLLDSQNEMLQSNNNNNNQNNHNDPNHHHNSSGQDLLKNTSSSGSLPMTKDNTSSCHDYNEENNNNINSTHLPGQVVDRNNNDISDINNNNNNNVDQGVVASRPMQNNNKNSNNTSHDSSSSSVSSLGRHHSSSLIATASDARFQTINLNSPTLGDSENTSPSPPNQFISYFGPEAAETAKFSDLMSEATLDSRGMDELLGPFAQRINIVDGEIHGGTIDDMRAAHLVAESSSVSLTRLLRWHVSRTNIESRPQIEFISQFRDAALACIDQKFPEAELILKQLKANPSLAEMFKKNKTSFQLLYGIAEKYKHRAAPKVNIYEGEFYLHVDEK